MHNIDKIKNSWTYKHIQLVVIVGLIAGIWGANMGISWPSFEGEKITYTKAMAAGCDLECEVMTRAAIIFDNNTAVYLEESRLQAIREINEELTGMVEVSPHVDYEEIAKILNK